MGALLDNSPPPPGAAASRNRKLAAILHADVVGFSRLMGEDEAGTHQALGKLRGAVDPLIVAHGGRIVGTAGDSLLADFSSVVDALNCALEMQRAARAINDAIPPERERGAGICARGATEPQVDPARVERLQRPELFGDDER